MSATVYRYDAGIDDLVQITMPKGAQVLHVAPSDRISAGIAFWSQADPTAAPERRVFAVVGTGNPMPTYAAEGVHVGSFQAPPFVWHVFEVQS